MRQESHAHVLQIQQHEGVAEKEQPYVEMEGPTFWTAKFRLLNL